MAAEHCCSRLEPLLQWILGILALRNELGIPLFMGMGTVPLRRLGLVHQFRLGMGTRTLLFPRMGQLVFLGQLYGLVPV